MRSAPACSATKTTATTAGRDDLASAGDGPAAGECPPTNEDQPQHNESGQARPDSGQAPPEYQRQPDQWQKAGQRTYHRRVAHELRVAGTEQHAVKTENHSRDR